MKPKILAILPGLVPSTIINVTTPLIDLHKAQLLDARVTLEMFVKDKDIAWSDLIVFCRNVEPVGSHWLLRLLENKKPFIYDIDDNFFEIPVDTSTGKYHTSPEKLAMLEEYIRHANLVRVYSEPMLERAKPLNLNAVKVNGPVDFRLLSPPPKRTGTSPIKIVYATSRVDDTLAEIFRPAIKDILKKYGDQVQMYFLGYNPPDFKTHSNVFFKPLNLNYEKYLRYFSSTGFDIGLAPLLNDVFHRSKTNLKVREFGACRIAGIYSDVDTYSMSVTHFENGLLVDNTPEAWYNAISLLIENRELRMQIQEQAYQFALENFSQDAFAQLWYSQITKILNQSTESRDTDHNVEHRDTSQNRNYTQEDIDKTRKIWFVRKVVGLVSSIRSNGLTFLFSYARMKIQMLWVLLKIRFTLN